MPTINLQQLIGTQLIPRDSNFQPIAPLAGIDPNTGNFVPLKLVDNGDGTFSLDIAVTISPGDINIGSIQIKDPVAATEANVVVSAGQPNALATKITGSTNSFFQDQVGLALTGAFQDTLFGFTSFSISLVNDDPAITIEYSFNGVTVHGRLAPGESNTMDFRAQPGIWLKGSAAAYRLMAY